jgi:hypothetical protein
VVLGVYIGSLIAYRCWLLGFEGLLSPKETLSKLRWEAIFGRPSTYSIYF